MTSQHLTEDELQRVAGGQQIVEAAIMLHLRSCVFCQEQLSVYKSVISSINEQPKAAFNFELANAVLQQLQPAPVKQTWSFRPVIIAAFIAIPLYLFRNNFLLLANGISNVSLMLSVITCIVIIGFKVSKLYQKHQRQVAQLDISE